LRHLATAGQRHHVKAVQKRVGRCLGWRRLQVRATESGRQRAQHGAGDSRLILKKSPGFLTGRGLSLTKVRHLKSPASPITPTRNAAFGSGAGPGRRGTNCHNLHLQGACWKCETMCQLLVARICHLAYLAIRRREGTDPWSVGTTSARPSGHNARSRTAPFLFL